MEVLGSVQEEHEKGVQHLVDRVIRFAAHVILKDIGYKVDFLKIIERVVSRKEYDHRQRYDRKSGEYSEDRTKKSLKVFPFDQVSEDKECDTDDRSADRIFDPEYYRGTYTYDHGALKVYLIFRDAPDAQIKCDRDAGNRELLGGITVSEASAAVDHESKSTDQDSGDKILPAREELLDLRCGDYEYVAGDDLHEPYTFKVIRSDERADRIYEIKDRTFLLDEIPVDDLSVDKSSSDGKKTVGIIDLIDCDQRRG